MPVLDQEQHTSIHTDILNLLTSRGYEVLEDDGLCITVQCTFDRVTDEELLGPELEDIADEYEVPILIEDESEDSFNIIIDAELEASADAEA